MKEPIKFIPPGEVALKEMAKEAISVEGFIQTCINATRAFERLVNPEISGEKEQVAWKFMVENRGNLNTAVTSLFCILLGIDGKPLEYIGDMAKSRIPPYVVLHPWKSTEYTAIVVEEGIMLYRQGYFVRARAFYTYESTLLSNEEIEKYIRNGFGIDRITTLLLSGSRFVS